MTGNFHEGHRERLKHRMLNEGGLDNFEDHQILELMLFYAIPRRDTNELAHKILQEFGGLEDLLNAEPEAIANRTGVSINTAILLSLPGKIQKRRIYKNSLRKALNTVADMKAYFIDIMKNAATEEFYIVCMDRNRRIIKTKGIEGISRKKIMVNMRNIMLGISQLGAVYAVCSHNHPMGTKMFSANDIAATYELKSALAQCGIKLMDHILVCGEEAVSMAEIRKFNF